MRDAAPIAIGILHMIGAIPVNVAMVLFKNADERNADKTRSQ